MTTSDSTRRTFRLTKDDIVRIIKRRIAMDGLEAAKAYFKYMNEDYSGIDGWTEVVNEVYDFFIEEQRKLEEKLHLKSLELQRAAAPNLYVANKAMSEAKSIGKEEIDKMNVEVKSPGNNIARIIKLGEDNNDK